MFTVLSKQPSILEFVIENVDVSIVNAVRRVILSEIPNVAVSFDSAHAHALTNDIVFKTNTSNMHNEFLGKRLSLMPLCFDADEIQTFDPDKYLFIINKKGGDQVTTGDIRIMDETGNPYPDAFVDKIFPTDPVTGDHILLAWLKPDATIHVEFRARKGIAMTHARWCPVSTCTYYNTLDEDKIAVEYKALKVLATELLKAAGKDDAAILDAKLKINSNENKFDTIDKYRLFKTNQYDEPSSFNFKVETECRLEPAYLVSSGLSILRTKVLAVAQKTKIEVINKETNMYALNVPDEDNTIGNLVQCSVYNNYVRANNLVDFIGYFQPHPLDRNIVFKIRLFDDKTDLVEFWDTALQLLAKTLDTMLIEWPKAKAFKASKTSKTSKTSKASKPKAAPKKKSKAKSGHSSNASNASGHSSDDDDDKTVVASKLKPKATKASAKKSVQ